MHDDQARATPGGPRRVVGARGRATERHVARLLRRVRLLAAALVLLMAAMQWSHSWPVPGIGPWTTTVLIVLWLLATNTWSLVHDRRPTGGGTRAEVFSDAVLALVVTVGGGALTSQTLPMVGLLVVVEAGVRLPRPEAYGLTAVFTTVSSLAVLALWPPWAGWEPADRLPEVVPTIVALPVACVLVARLAADRARTRRVARRQAHRLRQAAEELREANHRLETSNEELSAFAGRIAHDLRAPLGTITTALDTLERDELDLPDDVRDYLVSQARRAASRSVETVAALLAHASAEGRPPQCSLVDVGRLVEEARELGLDGIEDHLHAPRGAALAWADPHLLRLVLQNLVANAATHGGQGLSRIDVRVHSTQTAAVVSVEDDGVGIAPHLVEDVFNPGTHDSAGPGLGLGLATCRSIVMRHGGRIWAEAGPRGGAAVRFTLPWPDQHPGPTAPAEPTGAEHPAPEPDPAAEAQRDRATSNSSGSSNATLMAS